MLLELCFVPQSFTNRRDETQLTRLLIIANVARHRFVLVPLMACTMPLMLSPTYNSHVDRGAVVYSSNASHTAGRRLPFDFDVMQTSKQARQILQEVCIIDGHGMLDAKLPSPTILTPKSSSAHPLSGCVVQHGCTAVRTCHIPNNAVHQRLTPAKARSVLKRRSVVV